MVANKLTRRGFLTASMGVGAAALLAACAPQVQPTSAPAQKEQPTAAPAETKQEQPTAAPAAKPAAAGAGQISFLCRTDIKSAYAADKAAETWNANNESKVKLDEPAGDVVQKLQAAVAAGDLVWDGYAVIEMPWRIKEWVKRGLIAPLDDLIAASKIPNADKLVPGIIPTIKESVSFEGKQYGIPGNVGSVALAWFWEPLKAVGYEAQPITWDEVYDAAKKIKAKSPELTPFASGCTTLCDLWTMIWSAKEDPFDSDKLIDIRGKESIDALTWMRKMVEEELMPPTTKEQFGNWLKGGTAIITCYDVAGTMAQQTFGVDKADTGISFFPEKGKTNAGTPFWINNSVLLNKAKNPQGMVDFYLWWFSPDNDVTGKQITQVAAKPCYTYTYDKFVKPDKLYAWEQLGIDLVAKSKWFQPDTYFDIQNNMTGPQLEKCLDVSQKFEPQAAMDQAYSDIKAEIAKQVI